MHRYHELSEVPIAAAMEKPDAEKGSAEAVELKITEAQMPNWNAFADAFRATGQKWRNIAR
jgi:hypothetical protein